MKIEWTHHPETGHGLEQWTGIVDGISLIIFRVENAEYTNMNERYVWHNHLTGDKWKTGGDDTLEGAMRQAVNSTKEKSSE